MNQPQHMGLAGMGGPVGGGHLGQPVNVGTPNNPNAGFSNENLTKKLNTSIYEYLLWNRKYELAQQFLKQMPVETHDQIKQSPNQRQHQVNGIEDGMDVDSNGVTERPEGMPAPNSLSESNTFLQDWWCQFWEIFHGHRHKGKQVTLQYIGQQRQVQKARNGMLGNVDPSAMRTMPGFNGMMNTPMEMKKRALGNMNPQHMQQMQKMAANQSQVNQGSQMERQGSQMDMNGPRSSGSPNTGDAPSSPKRQRMDGSMQQLNQARPGQPGQMPNNQVGLPSIPPPAQSPLDHLSEDTRELLRAQGFTREDISRMDQGQLKKMQEQPTNVQAKSIEIYSQGIQAQVQAAMQRNNSNTNNKGTLPQNPNMAGAAGAAGAQSSPMSQAGVDGNDFYTNPNRMAGLQQNGNAVAGGQAGAAGAGQNGGNHALQDYQMQLMLLEQQNKKRLLMARQEQDSMSSHPPGVNAPNQGIMDASMAQQVRAPMMINGPNGPMMRPPSSHPIPNQMAHQMDMMSRQSAMVPNGAGWQGAGQQPPPNQIMPGQQQAGQGVPGQPPNMTPRQGNMAPPPAPQAPNTQPSSPAQPPAPPTPSQQSKAKPGAKKNDNKNTKAAANKKGGAVATDASDAPTATPPPPATPNNAGNFQQNKNANMANGQSNQAQQQNNAPNGQQPANAVQPPPPEMNMNGPFGDLDNGPEQFSLAYGPSDSSDLLDNFDFDMFLNATGEDNNLSFENFGFGETSLEAEASGL